MVRFITLVPEALTIWERSIAQEPEPPPRADACLALERKNMTKVNLTLHILEMEQSHAEGEHRLSELGRKECMISLCSSSLLPCLFHSGPQ